MAFPAPRSPVWQTVGVQPPTISARTETLSHIIVDVRGCESSAFPDRLAMPLFKHAFGILNGRNLEASFVGSDFVHTVGKSGRRSRRRAGGTVSTRRH